MMTYSATRRTVSRDDVDRGDAPSTKGDLSPPCPFLRPMSGHQRDDVYVASCWSSPSSSRRLGSASCIRQATTTSQIIHTTFRTQASTMAIVTVCEKPSVPATQPCTR